MRLEDIVSGVEGISREELLEKVRQIRKNKYEVKPASSGHRKKEAKSNIDKLMKGMPAEMRQALLKKLRDS